jgi:hypothetical protein
LKDTYSILKAPVFSETSKRNSKKSPRIQKKAFHVSRNAKMDIITGL